jgi:hypothetical protein
MLSEIKRVLDCGVCLGQLKHPICLDCGHVLCLDCLVSLQQVSKRENKKSALCPYCRKPFRCKNKSFWKQCIPLLQILELLTNQSDFLHPPTSSTQESPSEFDFDFEINLENLTSEELARLN